MPPRLIRLSPDTLKGDLDLTYKVIWDNDPFSLEGHTFTGKEIVRALKRQLFKEGAIFGYERRRFWLGYLDGKPMLRRMRGKRIADEDDTIARYYCFICGATDYRRFTEGHSGKCIDCQNQSYLRKKERKNKENGNVTDRHQHQAVSAVSGADGGGRALAQGDRERHE